MVYFLTYISTICECNKFTVQCCFLISILVSIFLLFGAIISSVILIMTSLTTDPSNIYVGEIKDGEPSDLNFNIDVCPRMNIFPYENVYRILQLNLQTDSESSESLLLHYYEGKDENNIYTNLISTCASVPGSVCTLRFPISQSHFFAVVVPTTKNIRNNSIQFIWYCDFWINPAKICSICFLVISLTLLLIFILVYYSCLSIRYAKYLEEKIDYSQPQKGFNSTAVAMEYREEFVCPEFPSTTPIVGSTPVESQIKYV